MEKHPWILLTALSVCLGLEIYGYFLVSSMLPDVPAFIRIIIAVKVVFLSLCVLGLSYETWQNRRGKRGQCGGNTATDGSSQALTDEQRAGTR